MRQTGAVASILVHEDGKRELRVMSSDDATKESFLLNMETLQWESVPHLECFTIEDKFRLIREVPS